MERDMTTIERTALSNLLDEAARAAKVLLEAKEGTAAHEAGLDLSDALDAYGYATEDSHEATEYQRRYAGVTQAAIDSLPPGNVLVPIEGTPLLVGNGNRYCLWSGVDIGGRHIGECYSAGDVAELVGRYMADPECLECLW